MKEVNAMRNRKGDEGAQQIIEKGKRKRKEVKKMREAERERDNTKDYRERGKGSERRENKMREAERGRGNTDDKSRGKG